VRMPAELESSNSNHAMQVDCLIHQQALFSEVIKWESVTDIVVPTVNLNRRSALNHCQFQQFLLETETEYGDVLYCISKVKKTLLALLSAFVNPRIVGPKLVWQCKANILSIYCNPNNKCYLLSLNCRTTCLVNCCISS
jgi:hypothetical protein